MKKLNDADVVLLLDPSGPSKPGEHWYWTGWKYHRWPADVIRPGFRFYVADGPVNQRVIRCLLEVVRGGAFTYVTRSDFEEQGKRVTGWTPGDDDPHFDVLPTGTSAKPCTGVALRWKVVKKLGLPFPRQFTQTGWLKLDPKGVAAQALAFDHADLFEGGSRMVTHKRVERNPKLRQLARDHWTRKMGGSIRCLACGFSFEKKYGHEGEGFIEMHHTLPLARLNKRSRRSPEDLIPLCSNCHRIIHRRPGDPLTLKQLKGLLS